MLYLILLQDATFTTKLALLIAYVLAVLFAITLHEFSHAFTAHKLGDPTPKALGRLSVNPFKHMDALGAICFLIVGFGWAKPVQVNPLHFKNYRKGLRLVSIAGVLTNIVLVFISSGLLYLCVYTICINPALSTALVPNNLFLLFLVAFFFYFTIINIALFVFNLIPVYPLDGFNFINTYMKRDNAFIRFMYKYGSIILLIIIIIPYFDDLYGFVTNGILNLFNMFWGLFV